MLEKVVARNWGSRQLLLVAVTVSLAVAGARAESGVEAGKKALAAGKNAQAIKLLEASVHASPADADALLNLGIAYKRSKNFVKAKTYLRAAMRAGRGTELTARANQELLDMPEKVVAPKSKMKRAIARIKGRRVAPAGITRVKLIAFTASWAQPCKKLQEDIAQARSQWGDNVEVVQVDVDDPKNEQLLDQYDVSPVPTVVFLDQDGQMVTFLVGYSGIDTLNSKVKTLTSGGGKPTSPTG